MQVLKDERLAAPDSRRRFDGGADGVVEAADDAPRPACTTSQHLTSLNPDSRRTKPRFEVAEHLIGTQIIGSFMFPSTPEHHTRHTKYRGYFSVFRITVVPILVVFVNCTSLAIKDILLFFHRGNRQNCQFHFEQAMTVAVPQIDVFCRQ
jgi:hypothetical protein